VRVLSGLRNSRDAEGDEKSLGSWVMELEWRGLRDTATHHGPGSLWSHGGARPPWCLWSLSQLSWHYSANVELGSESAPTL